VSDVSIALVLPELLGTYGDSGNAQVLANRLKWRGHQPKVIRCTTAPQIPSTADIYVIGGGEDAPQAQAASELCQSRGLIRGIDAGGAVLAVCAGLQILGRSFENVKGVSLPGLGVLGCETRRGQRRQIGEVVVQPAEGLGLPTLTGHENHAGVTVLDPGCPPLGFTTAGSGNGDGTGSEGAVSGHAIGTYLHGPVLARNPALADLLLTWVVGPLAPLDDSTEDRLRAGRLSEVRRGGARPGLGSIWRNMGGGHGFTGRPEHGESRGHALLKATNDGHR